LTKKLVITSLSFLGKFFCVPHSTENSLEKYRYRRKADEIRDTETRQRELMHKATNDWHKNPDNISNFLESLPTGLILQD
jgi:hypothetical protein